MKNPSNIAKELRKRGYKFSQTTFLKDLSTFEPVFQHNRYKFYDDSVVLFLTKAYSERYPVKVEEAKPQPLKSDLEEISLMLEAICRELNIKTTTETK